MTFHDTRIIRYLKHSPAVRNSYVAQIFGVEPSHIATLRQRENIYPPRVAAARARNMKPADLDDLILKTVYSRGLVDTVLK